MRTETVVELDGQYRVLREGAGLLDRSTRGKLLLTGSEAIDYLQGQITNDLEATEPGTGCYAALLDRKGHMQADMRVLRLADGVWLDTEPDSVGTLMRHLSMYKVGREVEISDLAAERAILSLIGPEALVIAGAAPISPEHAHREIEVGGIRPRAVATDHGLDLICDSSEADGL